MRVVFISDTHSLHDFVEIPEGDLFIHAGDLTNVGRINEVAEVGVWLNNLKPRFSLGVIAVAGNHDWLFQRNKILATHLLGDEITYLEDRMVEVGGLKIYGSPHQPAFMDWAFNVNRGEAIKRYWDLIPEGLDILVTHGPPFKIHDQSCPHLGSEHLGCEELLKAVERTKPKIHVFGHIHGGYGKTQYEDTLFINAAICDEQYKPINKPFVVDIPDAEIQKA